MTAFGRVGVRVRRASLLAHVGEQIALGLTLLAVVAVAPPSASGMCLSDGCDPRWSPDPTFAVSIAAPSSSSTVTGTATVSAAVTGNTGATRVEFYFDDILIADDSTSPYSVSWNTLDAAQPAYDGPHTLTARAYDDTGKVTSDPVTVTVANTSGTEYQATFASTTVPQALTYDPDAGTQQPAPVDVTVTNTSGRTWPGSSTKVGYRWLDPGTGNVVDSGGSVALGADVAAGASRQLRLQVTPPALGDGVDRAEYELRFDVYDAGGSSTGSTSTMRAATRMGPMTCGLCGGGGEPYPTPTPTPTATATPTPTPTPTPTAPAWFAGKGNKPEENPVIVNKAIETGLGLERYYHYEGADVGAGMQHLVNLASGNSLLRWTPFQEPGRGLSTVVDLTYNSLEKKCECPAGNNFSLSISSLSRLGLPLDIHPNKADEIAGRSNKWIEVTDGDGTTHRFVGRQAADGSTYWDEPAGVHLYLRHPSTTDPDRYWALTRPDRVTFYYDQDGFPTSVEDKNGNRLSFTLEAVPPADDPGGVKKRVTKVTDAGGRSVTIDYYSKDEVKKPQIRGRVQSITDHAGHSLVFDYYADGNLLRITQKGGTNPDGSTLPDRSFVFTYTTSNGTDPAIADPAARANPDANTPNQSTLLYSIRDPRGHETTFSYCSSISCGSAQNRWKLQSRTARDGTTTSYAYDIANRTTTVTAPLGRVSKYAYDTEGKVTDITNPLDQVTTLTWGDDRDLTKVATPGGGWTQYAYNANGYLTDETVLLKADDPSTTADETAVAHTKLSYENVAADADDVAGKWKSGRSIPHISQLADKTDPDGTATAAPADDYKWHFSYDDDGNLVTVTDPENDVTKYDYNADGTLAATTDPRGVATADVPDDYRTQLLDYDANGFPTRVVNPEGDVTRLGYDADGQVDWLQDANHSDYSPAANPGLDPRDYRAYFDYDPFHRLVRQSQPKSTKDASGKLIWSSVGYDENDNPVRAVSPHYGGDPEIVATADFDAMDRATKTVAPPRTPADAGAQTLYGYDAAGRLTSRTRPSGAVTATDNDFTTAYGYDPLDRVVTVTDYPADGTAAGARRTHVCYDDAGDLVSVTPPRGDAAFSGCPADTDFTRKAEYDRGHRLVKELDARVDGTRHTRSYGYDANGNLTTRTDERDHSQTRSYDERNLLTQVKDPFDADRDITTKFKYDPAGELEKLISPRAYDTSTDKSSFDDYVTGYHYDQAGRLVKISLPTGPLPTGGTLEPTFIHRGYDDDGNLLSTSVPTAKSDPGQLTDDEQTRLTYWDPGWIKTSDEPNDPTVSFDYRAEGWQTSRTPAGAPGETWEYYDDGLLHKVTDRKQKAATFGYDLDGNLTSATDARGLDDATKTISVETDYDGFDEPTKVRHRRKDDSSDPNWHFSTYRYDGNGNVMRRVEDGQENDAGDVVDGKGGRVTTLDYDANDWVTRQVDDGGSPNDCSDDQRVQNSFFETGWEKQRVVSRGAAKDCDPSTSEPTSWDVKQTTSWDYFRNGDLHTLSTVNGSGETLETHTVDYIDGGVYLNGNRVKDAFTQKGPDKDASTPAACAAGCTAKYAYDPRDMLVTESLVTDDGRTLRSSTYKLDAAGNIQHKEVTRPGGTETSDYKYVGNQLVQSTIDGTTAKYLYDPDGNLDCVGQGAWTSNDEPCPTAGQGLIGDYSYDYLDRLTRFSSYTTGGDLYDDATYSYDALSRPIDERERHTPKPDDPIGPEKETTFAYQGLTNLVTQEQHLSATGSLERTNAYSYDAYGHRIAMSRTPDPDGDPSTDDGLAQRKDYTYAYDPHGSASLLIDEATGKAQASYGYDPYGGTEPALTNERDPADPSKPMAPGEQLNPYRYDAKRFDTGSGTYDMGARRFGPDTARYLQQDQYKGALSDLGLSTDPLTQNRYALAGGNPVSYIETDGHMLAPVGPGGGGDDGDAKAAQSFSSDRAKSFASSSYQSGQGYTVDRGPLSDAASGNGYGPHGTPPVVGPGLRPPEEGALQQSAVAQSYLKQIDCDEHYSKAVCEQHATAAMNVLLLLATTAATEEFGPGVAIARGSAGGLEAGEEAAAGAEAAGSAGRAGSGAAEDTGAIAPKLGSRGGPGTGSRHIPAEVKQQEIEESQGLCRICNQPVEPRAGSPLSREFDHAWPYSRGGDTTFENIQSLCRTCNRQKGAMTTEEFLDRIFGSGGG